MVTRKAAAKSSAKPAAQGGKSTLSRALKGSVEIFGATGKRKTGAQAIAPDHSPRAKPAAAPVARVTPVKAPAVGGDTLARAAQFLYAQSEMLDRQQWQAYIDLFTDDGVYWMPALPEQTEWQGSPSIFAEDKLMMAVRMGRITHPNAWSQSPMWATNHVIGNISIESETTRQVVVRSRFHMMELRRDNVRHFGGAYRHTLVKAGKGFKIKLQRVDLFNGQAPFDYVLQIWV